MAAVDLKSGLSNRLRILLSSASSPSPSSSASGTAVRSNSNRSSSSAAFPLDTADGASTWEGLMTPNHGGAASTVPCPRAISSDSSAVAVVGFPPPVIAAASGIRVARSARTRRPSSARYRRATAGRARSAFTNRRSKLPAPRSALWMSISRRCSSAEPFAETKITDRSCGRTPLVWRR